MKKILKPPRLRIGEGGEGDHVWVPAARTLTRRFGLGFGLAAAIWLVSAWVPTPSAFTCGRSVF